LNIPKVLNLDIFHPRGYLIDTSYQIKNGFEGVVTLETNKIILLMATLSSQIGKHNLEIILTDYYQKSTSETISLEVINDPPIFGFGGPKS
jgi:predicted methyltransferase